MRAHFLGKDPDSQEGQSPTLFATDRVTYIAQGWKVTDPDDDENFLGGELIEDPALIVNHNYWRDVAWHHAIRRDDFATQQHLGFL